MELYTSRSSTQSIAYLPCLNGEQIATCAAEPLRIPFHTLHAPFQPLSGDFEAVKRTQNGNCYFWEIPEERWHAGGMTSKSMYQTRQLSLRCSGLEQKEKVSPPHNAGSWLYAFLIYLIENSLLALSSPDKEETAYQRCQTR